MRAGRNSASASRAGRWVWSGLYWLAVVAVSVVVVAAMLLWLQSCDASTVGA